MKRFLGICIQLGNLQYPRLRIYWESNFRVPCIADTITQSRFLLIFPNPAATSDDDPSPGNTNNYWKIHPIVETVRNACHYHLRNVTVSTNK